MPLSLQTHAPAALRLVAVFFSALAACTPAKPGAGEGGGTPTAASGEGQTPAGNGNTPAAQQPGAVGNGNIAAPAAPAAAGGNQVGPATGVTPGGRVPAIATLAGPNNAYVLVGRFDASNPAAIRFSLPNSRIGATFSGTSLGLSLAGDASDGLAVQVDGGAPVVVFLRPSAVPVTYPVVTNLAPGNHTVWITKRTESYEVDQNNRTVRTGTVTFAGVVLDASASLGAPPAPRGHLLVVLGDSSTTGYGVDQLQVGASKCVFSPNTQNALLSVPGQLADLLGSEVMNVSASGKGLVQSAYDPTNPEQLPALWLKTVPPAAAPAYAFPALDVDAVLLSVGSDDLLGDYGKGTITDPTIFVTKYTAMLSDMRGHYPQAVLVGLINPNAVDSDKTTLTSLITQAVASRNAAGDPNVFVFDYFAADPNGYKSYNDADAGMGLGHGCQGHASPAGSLFLAQRLASFLRQHATF